MKRGTKLFFVLLLITIISSSLVSAGFWSNFLNKFTGKTTNTFCTDSDGENFFTKGYIKTNAPYWNSPVTDVCSIKQGEGNYVHNLTCSGGNCYIIEYICNGVSPDRKIVLCENGCQDGACLLSSAPATADCIEDHHYSGCSLDYCESKGYTYSGCEKKWVKTGWFGGGYYDYIGHCTETVASKSCSKDNTKLCENGLWISCSNGCSNGACIKTNATTTINCKESDNGINYNVKGTACIGSNCKTDYCLDSNNLIEYYVKDNDASDGVCSSSTDIFSQNYNCVNGCVDGACVTESPQNQTNATCTDTDNGINLYQKGETCSVKECSEDYCQDNNYLFEYDCGLNNGIINSTHSGIGGSRYFCAGGCSNGACIIPSNITANCTGDLISVAAIKLQKLNFSFENAKNKINNLFLTHPAVDLIVTPEFLFYYEYKSDPVIINCANDLCNISSIGTSKSDELKGIIKYFQNIAQQNNVNLVLGTVSERINIDGINVSISTQLIIDKNGIIIGEHRATKKAEYYSEEVGNCEENPIFCDKVYQSQLETVRTFDLTNRKGKSFKVIPVICGEKGDNNFISRLSNSDADIAVLSEFDRDCDYEETTLRIQNGEDIHNISDIVCASQIIYIMQDWMDNDLLKQNSYWLISNAGDRGQTGIISWDMNKIKGLDMADDYIYGDVCVEASGIPECTDSDGGKNYYVSGNVTFSDGKERKDVCSPTRTMPNYLVEWSCSQDGKPAVTGYVCPNGCSNGACIGEENTINCAETYTIPVGHDGCPSGSCGNDTIVGCDRATGVAVCQRNVSSETCSFNKTAVCQNGTWTNCENGCQDGACITPLINEKNMSRYSDKEVFLISDKNWKDVLPLVPITTWTGNESCDNNRGYGTPDDVCVYPTLIFHEEEEKNQIDVSEDMFRFYVNTVNYVSNYHFCSNFSITNISLNKDKLNNGDNLAITVLVKYNGSETECYTGLHLDKYINLFQKGEGAIGNLLGPFSPGEIKSHDFEFSFKGLPSSFDADSIIYFMQQYSPDKVTTVGETPQELDDLLITSPDLGAGLTQNQIQRISPNDYFSYWKSFKDVIYVEDNYELALLASTYASLINAPLIIKGTDLDTANVFTDKNIICVGSVNPSGSSCSEQYNLEQLQQKYVNETKTDKIILVNPNDLNIKVTEDFQPEKSANSIYEIYGKTSLAAPILASAKHELMISTTSINYSNVDSFIKNKINDLGIDAEYLTLVASPDAIEMSKDEGYLNTEVDNQVYGNINLDSFQELAVGRIFGFTLSDISSYISRVLFYNNIIQDIPNNGMSIIFARHGDLGNNKTKLVNFSRIYYLTEEVRDHFENFTEYAGLEISSASERPNDPVAYGMVNGYSNNLFMIYNDHGSPRGYTIMLGPEFNWAYLGEELPTKVNPLVILNEACDLCAYDLLWEKFPYSNMKKGKLFCAKNIKKGAISFHGATDSTFGNGEELGYLTQKLYVENETIGKAMQYLRNNYNGYYPTELIIGDPTFNPR